MPPRGQDPNATTFNAADVIGSEGIGHHGELLLDALAAAYPPELQAVLQYRPNDELNGQFFEQGGYEGRLSVHEKVAKVAGVEPLELDDGRTIEPNLRVLRATIRGGADENGRNRDSTQAWISYVALDDTGDGHYKGVFPFLDLDSGEVSDRHFSQLHAAAETPAGRRYLAARKKEAAAADATAEPAVDPVTALAEAKPSELIGLMEEHPERVDSIKAFEKAHKARPAVLDYEPEPPAAPGDTPPAGGGAPPPPPAS